MSYEYFCFVSYPHGKRDAIKHKVEDFIAGLERELALFTPSDKKSVYYDSGDDGLAGGVDIGSELGRNLCKSVCLVFIYAPVYFDKKNLNCARELKAMHDLEQERLGQITRTTKGLIIPVIFGGLSRFPKSLQSRFYRDLTDISFANTRRNMISTKFSKQIKEIAQYIADRCYEFDQIKKDIWKKCDNFPLPSEKDAMEYVEKVFGNEEQPFPNWTEK